MTWKGCHVSDVIKKRTQDFWYIAMLQHWTANQFHSIDQDQSTVAQRDEMTVDDITIIIITVISRSLWWIARFFTVCKWYCRLPDWLYYEPNIKYPKPATTQIRNISYQNSSTWTWLVSWNRNEDNRFSTGWRFFLRQSIYCQHRISFSSFGLLLNLAIIISVNVCSDSLG